MNNLKTACASYVPMHTPHLSLLPGECGGNHFPNEVSQCVYHLTCLRDPLVVEIRIWHVLLPCGVAFLLKSSAHVLGKSSSYVWSPDDGPAV